MSYLGMKNYDCIEESIDSVATAFFAPDSITSPYPNRKKKSSRKSAKDLDELESALALIDEYGYGKKKVLTTLDKLHIEDDGTR